MSHPAQLRFVAGVKERFPHLFDGKTVLEIGSLDINGSIRGFFSKCDYVGVDLGPGPGVDLIYRGEELPYPDEAFDVVASCECFEHNPMWLETFQNMVRMSSDLVFFSCATTGRPEHGTPRTSPRDAPYCGEYYRNLTHEDFLSNLDMSEFSAWEFSVDESAHDLYFWGIKR